jgi:predicted nucleotide-binding protein
LPHVADPDFSHWKKGRDQAVQFLNNILSHIDEPFNKKQQKHSATSPESNPVFIVYGHNKNMLNEVARYLKKEEVNYIILEDLANKGDTLIEKFERSITENNVNYAIVLFSPDDHLLLPIEDEKHSREIYRVRQNILIELGYFMGKFGRGQTCVIFDKSKVEQNFDMPSDYQGVAWIAYDDNWKDDLRTELKGAHIIK